MQQLRLEARAWRIIVLALALFVAAVGFCVFDHHAETDHEHGAVLDLCLAMLSVAVVVVMPITLMALGWAAPWPASMLVPASLQVLDPPPKLFPVR